MMVSLFSSLLLLLLLLWFWFSRLVFLAFTKAAANGGNPAEVDGWGLLEVLCLTLCVSILLSSSTPIAKRSVCLE